MNDQPNKKYEKASSNENQNQSNCFIDKIIHIQNFYSKAIHQYSLRVQYVSSSRELNISRVLQQIHSKGLKIQNSQIFYQNVQMKMYTYLGTFPFDNTVYLKYEFCMEKVLKIRYKKLSDSPKNTNQPDATKESQTQSTKMTQNNQISAPPKQRNKQRKIGQALQMVKKWKKLTSQVNQLENKTHTLSSAAQKMGISKKTLDDYAYQIQVGYDYSFNFEQNKNEKIGVLRQYVKNKKKQQALINNTDNYWMGCSNQDNQSQNSSNGEAK